MIFGEDGAFDTFTITAVAPPRLALRHNGEDWPEIYPVGSTIIEIVTRTYYLRDEASGRPPQLVRYDGGIRPDVAVIDHVTALSFEYFADPSPPQMLRALSDIRRPWTTYGPAPPPHDTGTTPYTAGTNCLFLTNGGPLASPRLAALGPPGGALVRQPPARFTDGPWCPNDSAPNRFDADLLRIRSVGVSFRIESALAGLRGPAGPLFARGGTATAATGTPRTSRSTSGSLRRRWSRDVDMDHKSAARRGPAYRPGGSAGGLGALLSPGLVDDD